MLVQEIKCKSSKMGGGERERKRDDMRRVSRTGNHLRTMAGGSGEGHREVGKCKAPSLTKIIPGPSNQGEGVGLGFLMRVIRHIEKDFKKGSLRCEVSSKYCSWCSGSRGWEEVPRPRNQFGSFCRIQKRDDVNLQQDSRSMERNKLELGDCSKWREKSETKRKQDGCICGFKQRPQQLVWFGGK